MISPGGLNLFQARTRRLARRMPRGREDAPRSIGKAPAFRIFPAWRQSDGGHEPRSFGSGHGPGGRRSRLSGFSNGRKPGNA
jgi:hypothetical protein